MNAALCLTTLILTALAPTTSHKQVRDGENRAWMLIRSKGAGASRTQGGQLQILAPQRERKSCAPVRQAT